MLASLYQLPITAGRSEAMQNASFGPNQVNVEWFVIRGHPTCFFMYTLSMASILRSVRNYVIAQI